MIKHAPEWVLISDPVIISLAMGKSITMVFLSESITMMIRSLATEVFLKCKHRNSPVDLQILMLCMFT